MIEEGLAREKSKDGWIRTRLMFEVLGINEAVSKAAIDKLIERLDKEDPRVDVYKKEFGEVKKIDKPLPNVKEAFSVICDIELVSKNLDNLSQIVMEYGPSTIEILEPSHIDIPVGEAQGILNSISRLVHQFAASGAGGLVFLNQKKKVQ